MYILSFINKYKRIHYEISLTFLNTCFKHTGWSKISPIYGILEADSLCQFYQSFRHDGLKVCAGDCDDYKQSRVDDYDCSERILKFSNGNINFFLAQIGQRIEKQLMAFERRMTKNVGVKNLQRIAL